MGESVRYTPPEQCHEVRHFASLVARTGPLLKRVCLRELWKSQCAFEIVPGVLTRQFGPSVKEKGTLMIIQQISAVFAFCLAAGSTNLHCLEALENMLRPRTGEVSALPEQFREAFSQIQDPRTRSGVSSETWNSFLALPEISPSMRAYVTTCQASTQSSADQLATLERLVERHPDAGEATLLMRCQLLEIYANLADRPVSEVFEHANWIIENGYFLDPKGSAALLRSLTLIWEACESDGKFAEKGMALVQALQQKMTSTPKPRLDSELERRWRGAEDLAAVYNDRFKTKLEESARHAKP
jgi:hypothetical protein